MNEKNIKAVKMAIGSLIERTINEGATVDEAIEYAYDKLSKEYPTVMDIILHDAAKCWV